ncbi:MAG: hypothetical protein VW644_14815 [Alphaproteobacteria bacterium]
MRDEALSKHDGELRLRLEPGKCTGEIVASAEWLKMRDGTMTQSYAGIGEVSRMPGDEWFQAAGTRVNVCNRSNAKAVLVGVQMRPI